jgi:hypothetical protein
LFSKLPPTLQTSAAKNRVKYEFLGVTKHYADRAQPSLPRMEPDGTFVLTAIAIRSGGICHLDKG